MVGAIVLNGEVFDGEIIGDYVISTDGGYNKCSYSDLVVGDMDSVLGDITVPKAVFDKDKDLTDGEIAVDVMIEKGVDKVNLYGLNGGRLDHILCNINLMAKLVRNRIKCVCHCNDFTGYFVNNEAHIKVPIGSTISLSQYSDNLHIISYTGVKWELNDFILDKTSSRCMSNMAISNDIYLCVKGEVLVIVNK